VIYLVFDKSVADCSWSIGGNSPDFEKGSNRLRGGVLEFASRIGVRGLYADVAGKLQNGLLKFWLNGLLGWRMDSRFLAPGVS
jgi:hypothetical protein